MIYEINGGTSKRFEGPANVDLQALEDEFNALPEIDKTHAEFVRWLMDEKGFKAPQFKAFFYMGPEDYDKC